MPAFNNASLNEVTSYLFARREAILNNWRLACQQDEVLGQTSKLSREEFVNLLPTILNILEQRLLGKPEEADLSYIAMGHGLHRWHKANVLIESMQELDHLAQALYRELHTFSNLFPETDNATLLYVHHTISSVIYLTMRGSLQKYDELQRLQAASRVNTLERALEKMNALGHERGNMLRESSHDLRGSMGIVNSAATLLGLGNVSEEERKVYMDMLSRNLINVQSMLTNLMDLARLESGRETVELRSVDASQVLRDLVTGLQGMAQQRHIVLHADGPESLMVQTDPVKLQRIAQNILVNALKYAGSHTDTKAIVSVSWFSEDDYRWVFSIQDSGPGMPETIAGVFSEQLRPTVEPAALMGPHESEPVPALPVEFPQVPPGKLGVSSDSDKGEGVGLHIVKRLCDLLKANLDIESQKGRGTLFRVRLPVRYSEK